MGGETVKPGAQLSSDSCLANVLSFRKNIIQRHIGRDQMQFQVRCIMESTLVQLAFSISGKIFPFCRHFSGCPSNAERASPVAPMVKNLPAVWEPQETPVRSLGQEDPWRRKWQPTPVFSPGEYPWTEEPGGLQSMGQQRVGHDLETEQAGGRERSLRHCKGSNENITSR